MVEAWQYRPGVASITALATVLVGVLTLRRSLLWKRSELASNFLKDLNQNEEVLFACRCLDWNACRLVLPAALQPLLPDGTRTFDHDPRLLDSAMRLDLTIDEMSADARLQIYRTAMDGLLSWLSVLSNSLDRDLFGADDLPGVGYWVNRVVARSAFDDFISEFGYGDAIDRLTHYFRRSMRDRSSPSAGCHTQPADHHRVGGRGIALTLLRAGYRGRHSQGTSACGGHYLGGLPSGAPLPALPDSCGNCRRVVPPTWLAARQRYTAGRLAPARTLRRRGQAGTCRLHLGDQQCRTPGAHAAGEGAARGRRVHRRRARRAEPMEHRPLGRMASAETRTGGGSQLRPGHRRPLPTLHYAGSMAARQGAAAVHPRAGRRGTPAG